MRSFVPWSLGGKKIPCGNCFWVIYVRDRSIFLSIVSSSIAEGSFTEKEIPVSFMYTETALLTGIWG